MKKSLTILLIIICSHAFAQDSLKVFNNDRVRTTSTGMLVLGGWGVINLGTGAALGWGSNTHLTVTAGNFTTVTPNSPESSYFFQMNTIWGAVDFGTALLGYAGTQKYKNKKLSAAETLEAQKRIERIFLINEGLDVVYLGAGAYLKIAGDHRNSPMMKGYGESVLMQGGFLLIFDAFMHHAEKKNGTKLRNFLEKHPIGFNGRQVGITFNM